MLPDPSSTQPAVWLLASLWSPAPSGSRNPVSTASDFHRTDQRCLQQRRSGSIFVLIAEIYFKITSVWFLDILLAQ